MIELTNKDADFIATLARNEIKKIESSSKTIFLEMKDIVDKAENIAKKNPSKENLEGFKECEDEYIRIKENISSTLKTKIEQWSKVIELMITGSYS